MQDRSDEPLAGSRLTLDEDGRQTLSAMVAGDHASDAAADSLKLGTVAHEARQLIHGVPYVSVVRLQLSTDISAAARALEQLGHAGTHIAQQWAGRRLAAPPGGYPAPLRPRRSTNEKMADRDTTGARSSTAA